MAKARVTRDVFLEDPQGKTFADVVNDPEQPFDKVLEFFDDADRQRRMEEFAMSGYSIAHSVTES